MRSRRKRLPKGARTAARIVKLLGAGGTITLWLVCMVVAFCSVGARFVDTQTGNTACQLPDHEDGPGVAVFGDRALTGLAAALPRSLAGGKVRDEVRAARTAQQGENALNAMPDSAPGTFVMSFEQDDASDPASYTPRIDELMLLLSGRTVYWVTVPGKTPFSRIVTSQDSAGGGQSDDKASWHIVDFAAAVAKHHEGWSGGTPSRAGLRNLAQTIAAQIPAVDRGAGSVGSGPTAGITATSTTNASDGFPLTGERVANAKIIVSVGGQEGVPRSPGVTQRAEVVAMAAAVQESKLVNLPGGPGGAYGLFQQTPSQGWGTVTQVEDPSYAATAFYRHLFRVPGWENMSVTDAAQAVQQSAYPDAYAQWEQSANVIVAALTGQHYTGCGPQVAAVGSAKAQIAVNAALSQLGVSYAFAGGDRNGPTLGQCVAGTAGVNDCHVVGFDCSGLMLYAWGKAGVEVPHFTGAMWTDPDFVHISDQSQLQPGDMLMFDGPPPRHTGTYLGDGKLVDAPHSGAGSTPERRRGPRGLADELRPARGTVRPACSRFSCRRSGQPCR